MLRFFIRLLSGAPQRPSLIDTDSDRVVIYARVDRPPSETRRPDGMTQPMPRQLPSKSLARAAAQRAFSSHVSHRQRLFSMRLEYTKLCSPRRCQRLRSLGIVSAGDLASADPQQVAMHFRAPRKALRIIKQYRRAIRFAAAVPGMMPRDAMLLISIHRRSVRGLALESPAALHRDLERFAESTKGRIQLRGRRLPSTRRLKRWIAQCEANVVASPLKARAA